MKVRYGLITAMTILLVLLSGCTGNISVPESNDHESVSQSSSTATDRITNAVLNAERIVIGRVERKSYTRGNTEGIGSSLVYSLVTFSIQKVIKGEDNTDVILLKVVEDGQVGDNQTGISYQLINAIDTDIYHYVVADTLCVCISKTPDLEYYDVLRNGVVYITDSPSHDIKTVTSRITQIMQQNNVPSSNPTLKSQGE